MLVLDSPCTKEDAQAVQEFAKHVRQQEQERIIEALKSVEGHDWVEIRFDDLVDLIKED
jgi:hypothetical protein